MAGSSGERSEGAEGNLADSGKYVRYSNEQVEALERVYNECPKPSSARRQQLIKECPILANIEPKQIKVWFQNRRCRERQRMESNRLQTMNSKLTALNKLLVEENDLSTKKISQLTMENAILRQRLAKYESLLKLESDPASKSITRAPEHQQQQQQLLQSQAQVQTQAQVHAQQVLKLDLPLLMAHASHALTRAAPDGIVNQALQQSSKPFGFRADGGAAVPSSIDNSQESAVTNNVQTGDDMRPETSASGLFAIAEEILAEFIAKATGTAIDFVELPGMKAGSDFMGRVTIAYGGSGVAARAAGVVPLDPLKVAELLKDRMSWLRDCRRCDALGGFCTANGGTVELIYTQMYAPTTLAPPRDFCTLRYTTPLDDGGIVICERSLNSSHGGATMPAVPSFVRAEMLPSGYLIRPCDDGGCVIIAVDHMDLEPWSVPEVLRPLYESSAALAQRVTVEALRYLRRVAQETNGDSGGAGSSQQLAAWRAIAERIAMGFNEAVNGFADDNWVALASDGLDDVSVASRATSPTKSPGQGGLVPDGPGPIGGGVLCAKASMLLQNVPPALLIRFLRDHRSEWADGDIDANSAAAVRASISSRVDGGGHGQVPLPLAYAVDQEEFLELVKLEGHSQGQDGSVIPRETFLLQLCSGVDETAVAMAQLVFAPVDAASTADTVPLLPSGFRVIPLDSGPADRPHPSNRTLDLASALEGQSEGGRQGGDASASRLRSVLTIAFQFVYEGPTREAVAVVARQYVRSVVSSVQRVAMALTPSRHGPLGSGHLPSNDNSEAMVLLSRRVLQSYRLHVGVDIVRPELAQNGEAFKAFWEHADAIVCVAWKAAPELLFANQAGLEMLETTAVGLSDIQWEKLYDEEGTKTAYAAFSQVMQQGYAYLPSGILMSSTGRPARYERAVAWKVVDEKDNLQCIALMHMQWAFVS